VAGTRSSLVFLAALALSSPAASADRDLCGELRNFETAAPDPSDNPAERRWLEIHWAGEGAGTKWSRGCRHSKQEMATLACLMVMNQVRPSNVYAVPQSIMACYGYRFAPGAVLPWQGLVGNFVLKDQGGRRVTLELDFRDLPDGEEALRLVFEEAGKAYQPAKLPRITPFQMPGN
jgi:hypothetical protein